MQQLVDGMNTSPARVVSKSCWRMAGVQPLDKGIQGVAGAPNQRRFCFSLATFSSARRLPA